MGGFEVIAVKVREAEKIVPKIGGDVQIVSAPCYEAVVHAAVLALRAFQRGTNRAKTLGGELLLRLSGRLQIKDAIKENGIKEGLNYLVIFDGGDPELKLKELGLRKANPVHCDPEKLKPLMEKSALVEAL
ncbi:KEOPS complex subunit Cgi121 [Thermococcus gammatolerans]|uniref:KEOPS complex Cgi121-like subunit n=1 Tax=Thermococcus gammatolerans (strain DSM 15229 / JCM 11827 / EJ3) TaxID=593117 RepID=C5A1S2_THEGJ|nr:KEOPS complex subunit Cgi121 [Thermococcus gammatolerans]ACS34341.1 Conserved hypothetical protein [Thermococcus gammatolerans EJ3]